MRDIELVEGLESLRRAERSSVSRVLHDEIGPALCSAGLVLGLLRSEAGRLPAEGVEWLELLQSAMESAMESARLLSYGTDPALATRCGLATALEYLTKCGDLSFDLSKGIPDWTVAQNETVCRIVRDLILAIPGGSARLEASDAGLTLYGSGTLKLDEQQRSALRLIAELHQLGIVYEVPTEATLFSLGLLKAN